MPISRYPYQKLGDPVTFFQKHFQRQWWVSHIQSYAQLRVALKGEGLHQHHLLPKTLFLNGPKKTQRLIDYIPSISFTEDEHLKTLHSTLNEFLKSNGLWRRRLSRSELERAMRLTAQFYEGYGLDHFAAALRGFKKAAYDKVK
jgi:hypothetical protein